MGIIILAIYNSVFIPIEIAFEPPQLQDSTFYQVIDFLIDFIFIIDIIIGFRTTYITNKGEEVFDKKKIAKRYLLG